MVIPRHRVHIPYAAEELSDADHRIQVEKTPDAKIFPFPGSSKRQLTRSHVVECSKNLLREIEERLEAKEPTKS